MRKRFLALLLAGAVALGLCGCTPVEEDSGDEEENDAAQQQQMEEAAVTDEAMEEAFESDILQEQD